MQHAKHSKLYVGTKAYTFILFAIAVLLWMAHFFVLYLEQSSYPHKNLIAILSELFNMNNESNIPTFFSTLIMLLAAVLLFIAGCLSIGKPRSKWFTLGILFIFLSMDEAAQIHEKLQSISSRMIGTDAGGLFSWAWVVPYSFLTIAAILFFWNWVWNLPVRTRIKFLVSGFLYVLGALVLEMVEGRIGATIGWEHNLIIICFTLQEILEMTGVILFINALLGYLATMNAQHAFPFTLVFVNYPNTSWAAAEKKADPIEPVISSKS